MKENNKLIAEFMDLRSTGLSIYKPSEYKYHTSWDWLMPVIEKCLVGEAEQSEEISNTTIKNIYEGICNQDISFAYKSVVEFIKDYNNGEN
tara:strand:- start:9197 stop:9469 length:273 start_codon:yes stop_codon:yes gene_type:complete